MEGKLVRLRGYELSDLDTVMKWINDEEVTQFLGGKMTTYPISSIAERKFIETVGLSESSTEKTFVIETLADKRFIGALSFNGIDWMNRHSGVGIDLRCGEFAHIDHVIEEPYPEVSQFLKPFPIDRAVLYDLGEIDRTKAARLIREQRLFTAGIGRFHLTDVGRGIRPVDSVDENDARVTRCPG